MSYSHRLGGGQVLPAPRNDPNSPAGVPRKGLSASVVAKTGGRSLAKPVAPVATPAKALRAMPLTRRYESCWLSPEGQVLDSTRLAPATPLFEEAFSALARGAVIATLQGPVAVEDLVPGMQVTTAEGRVEAVTWVGSMMIYPGAGPGRETEDQVTLTRITSEAFGHGKPGADVVLGPRARLCLRDPRLKRATGLEAAYVPARAFIDGVSVIEVTPAAPVTVYHVVLERHGSLRVAGLEVEAFHPGEGVERMIDPRMLSLFEAQFPQLARLADFGKLAHPRLTRFEVETLWE